MLTLVTGAAGHVGGNLVRRLLELKRPVRVLVHRDTRALEGLEVERAQGDVLDPNSLLSAMRGVDVVFHLTALISITGDAEGKVRRTNVEAPRNVTQACLKSGVKRLIHFSSIHAFQQEPLDQPVDETREQVLEGRAPATTSPRCWANGRFRPPFPRGLMQ